MKITRSVGFQVESEIESVRVQLEEESEARLELERQLVKANGEISIWRSKYETEASARAEEVSRLILVYFWYVIICDIR